MIVAQPLALTSFTFALDVDPLEDERDDFLGVDVSVARDVLDGLQEETQDQNGGTSTQEDGLILQTNWEPFDPLQKLPVNWEIELIQQINIQS